MVPAKIARAAEITATVPASVIAITTTITIRARITNRAKIIDITAIRG